MSFNLVKLNSKSVCGLSLLAAASTSPAMAEDWQLGLGANLEQFFGYVSYDGATSADYDGVDAVGTAEVFLRPLLTMDNGLRFGANLDLEGHLGERNAGAEFDEASVFVKGSFGEFLIGKSDTPGNHMHFGAPAGYGPDINFTGLGSAALPSLLQFSNVHNGVRVGDDLFRGTLGSTQISNLGEETQGRVAYYSPRFAGFQLGASYADETPNDAPNRRNFFDIGANYMNSFGGLDVGVSAKWGTSDNSVVPTASPEYWGAGLNFAYGDFSVGGSYAESSGSAAGVTDGRAFDIGAKYQTGRFGVSLHYLNGENTDNENAGLGVKERLEAVTLAAGYYLTGHPDRPVLPPGPGSDYDSVYGLQQGMGAMVFGFVSYADFSEDIGDGGIGTPGDDVDGFVIGTGFRLTF